MTFVLLAAGAALGTFAVVAAVSSAALALAFGRAADLLERYSARSRAAVLFRLRLVPPIAAIICGFGVSLPIFVIFEPRDTDEPVSRTLVAIACVGGVVLCLAALRAFKAWRHTRRVSREWLRQAHRLDPREIGLESTLPVYAIDAAFPTVAVVGITSPTLFIAERVLAECSVNEVRAMIAHECAHVYARDNLKRFALRACPDLLSRRSDVMRAWVAATEEAADAAAVTSRPGSALDLAQALIRVARLAPSATPELASSFYPGGDIERRIRRLVDPVSAPDAPPVLGRWMVVSAGITVAGLAIIFA
ncbi:MAG TPA: M48 family metalloprotease, partial [Vicinamibacterales bacterium]